MGLGGRWLISRWTTGALGLRRGLFKTSQVGPFCLVASFLCLQKECGLQNLAPVAWHLVKLIHRQETNCQLKWVSRSLPLPSRLACGWDGTSFLPLFPPCRPLIHKRNESREGSECLLLTSHLLDNQLKMWRTISFHVIPRDTHSSSNANSSVTWKISRVCRHDLKVSIKQRKWPAGLIKASRQIHSVS